MIENQNKELLTIVSPAYNEAENLDELYSRILNATENLNLEIEIIYVNDGSNDNTIEVINRQSENDGRITVIDLSRNFGKEIALTAGLDHASGDAVIVIDSDLQDPPEVIPQLVEKWRDGNDVVNAGDGDDTVYAGGGDDIATGGAGNDTLLGMEEILILK